ncbi:MAG: CoA-binding protein [Planctomycetota bacterium]
MTDFPLADTTKSIELFLAGDVFAVAGASANREKYGNIVFRRLIETGHRTYPLNPASDQIEGHPAYAALKDLPEVPQSLSIVTPPKITRQVVAEAIDAGVKVIWMQPGAEDNEASDSARAAGIEVIDDGSCLLVLLAGS